MDQDQEGAVLPHQHPILKRARDQFRPRDLMYIDVDAWPDEDEKPTRLYFYPYTTKDKAFAAKRATIDGAGVEAEVDVLIRKAVDQHGEKIFGQAHRNSLLTDVDPNIISAIVGIIMTARNVADHIKNLKAMPADG